MKRIVIALFFAILLLPIVSGLDRPAFAVGTSDSWKQAYSDVLATERRNAVRSYSNPDQEIQDCYVVYDIDKDGIPELIIRRNLWVGSRKDFPCKCYTFQYGRAVLVWDNLDAGNTLFASYPAGNGLLLHYEHMGDGHITRISIRNGRAESSIVFQDDLEDRINQWYGGKNVDLDYTPVGRIFNGASYLTEYDLFSDSGIWAHGDASPYSYETTKLYIGDTYTFGSYRNEPITWIVLDKDESGYLLLSKYGLEALPYNDTVADVTWQTCTLRSWLNGTFYNTAFSYSERTKIRETLVRTPDNPKFGTDGGYATHDKLFCLSIGEVDKYFSKDGSRACIPTEHARIQIQTAKKNYLNPSTGACFWWLRNPGESHSMACAMMNDSEKVKNIEWDGNKVSFKYTAVRPAMWIDLD